VSVLIRVPPVYVFVLWSQSRDQEQRILDHLAIRFTVVDLVEVTWTPDDTFARSLTRMYGDALPPGSDKERQCGTGPFLLVVVEDPAPRFRLRPTGRGRRLLNSNVYDARLRYRQWTGGGYRVHASDSLRETERNLQLLLGEGMADLAGKKAVQGARRRAVDPVGTHGWTSEEQLLRTLAAYGARLDGRSPDQVLHLAASDVWWAEHIAGGRELAPGRREVRVDGRPLQVQISQRISPTVRAINAVTARLLRS
jgi:hypothetical protein